MTSGSSWPYGVGMALALSVVVASGCAGKKDNVAMLLAPEQLYAKGLSQIAKHNLIGAVRTLEKVDIGFEVEKRDELEPLIRLALADATFYQDTGLSWIDAQTLYADFVTFYPAHPLAPYAQFQVGVCSLKQVNHPAKDQSQTIRAIAELGEVGRRFPDSIYASAGQAMIHKAEDNLAEHEFLVGRFYLKRKKYFAAADRFQGVLDHFPEYAQREDLFYYLGRSFVLAEKGRQGRKYLDQLIAEYPNGKFSKQARKTLATSPPVPDDVETDHAGNGNTE